MNDISRTLIRIYGSSEGRSRKIDIGASTFLGLGGLVLIIYGLNASQLALSIIGGLLIASSIFNLTFLLWALHRNSHSEPGQ